MCQCVNTMEQTAVEQGPAPRHPSGVPIDDRPAVGVLSSLPGPVRAAIVLAVSAVVAYSSLSQAGILAPQDWHSGGGSGSVFTWSVERNVGLRAWRVAAIEVTGSQPVRVVAFLMPSGAERTADFLDALTARAQDPRVTALPLTVPPDGELVVLKVTDSPCAADGPHGRTGARIGVDAPLGRRWITSNLSVYPDRAPCPSAAPRR